MDAIPFATRAFEFLLKHSDKDQDTVFDAVTCFVIMADDFKNKDQTDLAKKFLGYAGDLAQVEMTSQTIGRTWPIAFGRLALLYYDLNDYKAAITASNKALSAFKNGFNAGKSDISAMDLACMFALLSEIYSVRNQPKQMEQCDNSITGLAITANMIEGAISTNY